MGVVLKRSWLKIVVLDQIFALDFVQYSASLFFVLGPFASTYLVYTQLCAPHLKSTKFLDSRNSARSQQNCVSYFVAEDEFLRCEGIKNCGCRTWIADVPELVVAGLGFHSFDIWLEVHPHACYWKVPEGFWFRVNPTVVFAVLGTTPVHHPDWIAFSSELHREWSSSLTEGFHPGSCILTFTMMYQNRRLVCCYLSALYQEACELVVVISCHLDWFPLKFFFKGLHLGRKSCIFRTLSNSLAITQSCWYSCKQDDFQHRCCFGLL